jgi:hypothetical protein
MKNAVPERSRNRYEFLDIMTDTGTHSSGHSTRERLREVMQKCIIFRTLPGSFRASIRTGYTGYTQLAQLVTSHTAGL